ncbi:hypothetical protein G7Y89_g5755 [Cudoniella acicularis]|uniref:Uncharacterized protein n=1 Tax=Cudoniella acicularis TaxID=354080 RepID=A0A8H4RP65_9HELO|nr:hypothetical protein G7Y89_g5755 [Cudoniella acicularis]
MLFSSAAQGLISQPKTVFSSGFNQGSGTYNEDGNLKSARIRLWPQMPIHHDLRNSVPGCNNDMPFREILLATETCLSGDYYLQHNFLVMEDPVCADGSKPVMVFYPSLRCSGSPMWNKNAGDAKTCLWRSSPTSWSLVYRCGIWPTLQEGADAYMTASPPVNPAEFKTTGAAQSGTIETHPGPLCDGELIAVDGSTRPINLPVDRCVIMLGQGLRITKPAICPNGTRAKLARFEGWKCNFGEVTFADGLLDIRDEDIGQCKTRGNVGKRVGRVQSMSFWCDGFGHVERPMPPQIAPPKPRAGSISESACQFNKAPFFRHPKTDTCLNLSTQKLKIFSAGICANGTQALWAKYSKKDCAGSPTEVVEVENNMLMKCLDVEGTFSFSFRCAWEGMVAAPPQTKGLETQFQRSSTTPRRPLESELPVLMIAMSLLGVVVFAAIVFVVYTFGSRIRGLFRRNDYGPIALHIEK